MSEKIMSIIVLNWNRLEYTKQTINRLLETTTMPNQLILVDNNSTEESGVRQYLDTVNGNAHTIEVIRVYNSINYGVGGGRNTGLMKATGDIVFLVDDDVLVPPKWDVLVTEALTKVPRMGLTGICVEGVKYPVKVVNGVRIRPKVGNLGGAALAMSSKVLNIVGFFMHSNLYGHEDSFLKCSMDILKLRCAYIEPMGKHLDTNQNKAYRKEKDKAHAPGSKQLKALAQFRRKLREQYQRTGSLYVPFNPDNFNPIDKDDFTNELIKKK